MRILNFPLLILLVLLFLVQPGFCKTIISEKSVREAVESLCMAEFNGDIFELRKNLVTIDQQDKRAQGQKDYDWTGVVYLWDWYEMDVVTSYSVEKIEIGKMEAKVTITYDKIAEQKGNGIIKPVTPTKIQSVMTVIETPNGLRVLNPPVIKVSKAAVEKYYYYQYYAKQTYGLDDATLTSAMQLIKSNLEAIGSSVPLIENN